MTDKEIIKALKICESEYLGCEDNCPFNEECKKDTMAMGKAIFDLINRKDKRIADLQAEIERLRIDIDLYKKIIKNTREEMVGE